MTKSFIRKVFEFTDLLQAFEAYNKKFIREWEIMPKYRKKQHTNNNTKHCIIEISSLLISHDYLMSMIIWKKKG